MKVAGHNQPKGRTQTWSLNYILSNKQQNGNSTTLFFAGEYIRPILKVSTEQRISKTQSIFDWLKIDWVSRLLRSKCLQSNLLNPLTNRAANSLYLFKTCFIPVLVRWQSLDAVALLQYSKWCVLTCLQVGLYYTVLKQWWWWWNCLFYRALKN